MQQEQENAPEVEEIDTGTAHNAPQKTKVTKTHHLFNFTPHRNKKLSKNFRRLHTIQKGKPHKQPQKLVTI